MPASFTLNSLDWQAPAKINLFLHVTGQRDDGYHELQTLFQFLDYSDLLGFEATADGLIQRIDVGESTASLPDEDLCVQAARLLQAAAGITLGAKIVLEKKLPTGGGLGGGSSDAATTLIALNQLWQANLSRAELMGLGLQLGADVPIFIYGHAAFAEGVGERLTRVQPEEVWYCVLVPKMAVSTAEIFSDSTLTRDHPIKTIRGSFPQGRFDADDGQFVNDLEPVTCRLYPQVADTLSWLKGYGEAHMSGSGASVFVAVSSEQLAKKILDQRPEACEGFVAKGMNVHPHAEL